MHLLLQRSQRIEETNPIDDDDDTPFGGGRSRLAEHWNQGLFHPAR
jgi:hypothetical protein